MQPNKRNKFYCRRSLLPIGKLSVYSKWLYLCVLFKKKSNKNKDNRIKMVIYQSLMTFSIMFGDAERFQQCCSTNIFNLIHSPSFFLSTYKRNIFSNSRNFSLPTPINYLWSQMMTWTKIAQVIYFHQWSTDRNYVIFSFWIIHRDFLWWRSYVRYWSNRCQ